MKRFLIIFKWFLIAWGLVCLGGAILLGVTIFFSVRTAFAPEPESKKPSSKADVRFVLNWCNLGDDRIEEIVHSYKSGRSFTGDHLDAEAIRISNVDAAELTKVDFGSGWVRCDKAEGVLKDAIEFVEGCLHEDGISWFPKADELNSSGMYVYSWSIYCHGSRPTAVQLIFVRPKDKMIFYIDTKV